ncbi:hypothetical protein TrVE_jg5671 [Triparma verrucosa]|uniref:Amino acid transporter transmembrane domain-containing protein n=1 Tax=Triparma verrucosa TaxID=1606542 RepID=A0A9W7ESV6_9STRA|nr:hypothetical protein TrVE_jg5671 [Triparma verrucosa]
MKPYTNLLLVATLTLVASFSPGTLYFSPVRGVATALQAPHSVITPRSQKLQPSSLALSSSAVSEPRGGASTNEGASIPNEVFNLVKNIVGAGVLSLPAGVAAFGNHPTALLPAAGLILFIGTLSAYCFSLIGRVCSMTGATTYRGCWDKSVGTTTSWLPASACTFKTGVANVAYSMILADTFKSLASTAGYTITRSTSLLSVTSTVLLPLCLLRDLKSLAPFSLLGIVCMGFTTAAMFIRYIGGSYVVPTGKFVKDLSPNLVPAFGEVGIKGAASPKAAILLCMLSTAYLAHYNAPKFYAELKDNTVKRFNKMVTLSFTACISIFIAVTSIGFLTFGSNSAGLILNNYSERDGLATACRIALALSIVFSYPLTFVGIREGIFDLSKTSDADRVKKSTPLSLGILAVVTCIASQLKDLSFVLSFGGATLGNSIVFLFPSMMFAAAVKKMGRKDLEGEVKVTKAVGALGIVMGIIGGFQALKSL